MSFSKTLNDFLLISKSVVTVFPQCVLCIKLFQCRTQLFINLLNINIQYRFPVRYLHTQHSNRYNSVLRYENAENGKCVMLRPFTDIKVFASQGRNFNGRHSLYELYQSKESRLSNHHNLKVIRKILSLKISASAVYF